MGVVIGILLSVVALLVYKGTRPCTESMYEFTEVVEYEGSSVEQETVSTVGISAGGQATVGVGSVSHIVPRDKITVVLKEDNREQTFEKEGVEIFHHANSNRIEKRKCFMQSYYKIFIKD